MDIALVYRGETLMETDLLLAQRNMYEGFGLFVRDMVGSVTKVSGLACNPNGTPNLTVLISPGRLYSLQNLTPTALGQYLGQGGVAVDTNADHQIVKQGILRDTTQLTGFVAPVTTGQSINYLIQAAFSETDSTPGVRQFYNSSTPTTPIGQSVSSTRQNLVSLNVKAGTAAATGSQVTPSADSGYVPLYIVTVAFGQTTITAGNIAIHGSAPFLAALSASRQILTGGLASGGGDLTADRTITVTAATTSDIRIGTSAVVAATPAAITGSAAFITLTDAATVAWDVNNGYNATVTMAGNRTIGAPTNLKDGITCTLELVQDATGSRVPSWNAIWDFGAAGTPTLQTAATKADKVFGQYNARTGKIDATFRKGA